MSATLRHDIGQETAAAIDAADPAILEVFKAKTASRWGGLRRARWVCCTFAVKLPRDAAATCRLLLLLARLSDQAPSGSARGGCATLRRKLVLGIGLPASATVAEEPFLAALRDNPGERATWSAYADWLQEQEDFDM